MFANGHALHRPAKNLSGAHDKILRAVNFSAFFVD